MRYRQVLENLRSLSPRPIETLHVIGGGSRNDLLNQFTANAIGIPVVAGPSEATAIGNVMIQAMAAGEAMQDFHLSLHCWQADDVAGFEVQAGSLTGGIQATGNYPGKARNIDELRADILKAASYIPGTHRLNLHEIYGDFQR